MADIGYFGLTTFAGTSRSYLSIFECAVLMILFMNIILNIIYEHNTDFFMYSGYQTLGEEYVNIVQVNHTKRALPSKLVRLQFHLQ